MNSTFEVFITFTPIKDDGKTVSLAAVKGLDLMIGLVGFTRSVQDIKKILGHLTQIVKDNQSTNFNDPVIQEILRISMNAFNKVLQQLASDEFEEPETLLDSMQTLISFWLIHLINLEQKSHNNFEHIETFIHFIIYNQQVILGKNNQNLSGILKLLSISITEYCLEQDEEKQIAELLMSMQTQFPMVFVMAISLLDNKEKQFINKLVKTKGQDFISPNKT
eukprot:403348270